LKTAAPLGVAAGAGVTVGVGVGIGADADPADPLGAFCAHAVVARAGIKGRPGGGRLQGMRFAVKDVFAIAGETACFGNPTWLATHAPATTSATAVRQLLDAGASLTGVTLTDELAFSLTGENAHYGTPINSANPARVPGGSSSGSAAAVAGGVVDFALGTDTGGSVRVPASHCGLFGFRPTHGAVSTEGVLPFAPRFDTVGWFARDAVTLAAVGDVLLPPARAAREPPRQARLPTDATALLAPAMSAEILPQARAAARRLGLALDEEPVGGGDAGPLESWLSIYVPLQAGEIDRLHRQWIEREQPRFGPVIAGRITSALAVLDACGLLILPSAAEVAPPRGQTGEQLDAGTGRSLTLSAIASLGGLPQLSLPLCSVEGLPVGLSLVAAPGQDRRLLALALGLASSPTDD
jgi:amidase